jgi:hypothetical protein
MVHKKGDNKMSIEQVCLSIKRGDTWSRTLYFEDGDGAPIDITGWTVFFTAKAKVDDLDAAAVISKTITVFTNPTAGEAGISLSSTDTNQVIGSYLYDIQVKTNLNEIITVLEGILTITKDITIRTS